MTWRRERVVGGGGFLEERGWRVEGTRVGE